MIIDEQAAFRSLLMHHVTTRWPDAIISAYDPTAAGHLPDEFSGAGNDVILLGDRHGDDREGVDVLQRFVKKPGFPPVIYFGSDDDSIRVEQLGPDVYFRRDRIDHKSFVQGLDSALRARHRPSLTGSLSVGDLRGDAHPAIKDYRVLRKLSATEHSGVYLGERKSNGQQLVLKLLRQMSDDAASQSAFDRFLREYEAIADMQHRNVVGIFDLGVSDDHAYIAMEYLDNGDLRYRINSGIDETRALDYLLQIASALSAIHSRGVLHRDLKPANIMLRKDGSLALIDFGLAKRARLASAVTDEGEIFGTPYYMSPEQGHGNRVDERSDIYSLGVIFYEMLTGLKPFHASTAMGVIYRHAQAPIPQLPQRYADYQALLERLLAKAPQDRVQTAAEVQQWLQ
jgi:serine/threonine protein kinase